MRVDERGARLSEWFQVSSRPLPWRKDYDPYAVWTSEVMLQQTQVGTVLPYYRRFMDRFPTIADLAAAPEEAVLGLWSGLGYYNRARNFRRAAIAVVDQHGGRIPDTYDALIALPGIGRYMAGAILSIAFNQPWPIVDGNVRRVLARHRGWLRPSDSEVWAEAADIVRSGVPRIVNQGMMELGATVCTPRNPSCHLCPWQSVCEAFAAGIPEQVPAARKRPGTVRVDLIAVVDRTPGGVLMRENEGLWEFPFLASAPDGDTLVHAGHCRHAITHHRVEVDVYVGRLGRRPGHRRVRFEDVPVTALTRKIYTVAQGKV